MPRHRSLLSAEKARRLKEPAVLVREYAHLTLRLNPSLHARMRECAELCGVSANGFVERAIERLVSEIEDARKRSEGDDHETDGSG